MLPPRLSRKFEDLNAEEQAHIESQIDLIRAMTGRGQPERPRAGLRLVPAPNDPRIAAVEARLADLKHLRQRLLTSQTALAAAQAALSAAQIAAQATLSRQEDAAPWMVRLVADLQALQISATAAKRQRRA
jgi:hypothetical protein